MMESKFVKPSMLHKTEMILKDFLASKEALEKTEAKKNMDYSFESSSRRSSIADEVNTGHMEQELFRRCKISEEDAKANSGALIRALESMGILRGDPRIKPVIAALENIKEKNPRKIYSINNINLDFNEFTKVVKQCLTMISDAMEGNIVIPEFKEFCDDIEDLYIKCKNETSGKPAAYIPQLARGDPTKWGVSLCTIDGQRYSIGDTKDNFSIQSTSKPFTYALCVETLGCEVVQKYIGREPSGRSFNEIVMDHNNQPHNPLVNSGAIMSAALLLYMVKPELSVSEKFEFVHNFFTRMAGGMNVGFQNSTFLSERDSADRNNALAYFMREGGCFPNGTNNLGGGVDIKSILDFYFQTCSLEMNCESMSVMAGTLANGGICPITGERVLDNDAVKNVLSLMYSCGMYNYSGQFAFQVGLPAKSGVSGIVIVVVPDVVGFATYSPNLDQIGNSSRGVMFAEELVKIYNFHTFDSVGRVVSQKKNPRAGKYEDKSIQIVKLLLASHSGDKMALERAFLGGQDMNMGDYDNRTALHLACCEGHVGCVKFLIDVCKVELDIKDRWGTTPLEEAMKTNNMRVVAILRKHMAATKKQLEKPIAEEKENSPNRNRSSSSSSGTESPTNSYGSSEGNESGIELSKSVENLLI